MKKAEIQIGKTYIAKVAGKLAPVKIVAISPYGGWIGRNQRTGRDVLVRSAARLRQEYTVTPPRRPDLGPATPPTDLTTPRKAPAERGIKLGYMRAWRQQQFDAGKDSSVGAFFRAHGLCPNCRGRGDEPNSVAVLSPVACLECGGTGLAPSTAPPDLTGTTSILRDESGQDLVEYSLIIAAIALALVATLSQLSGGIASLYQSIVGRLTGVEWQDLI